MRKQELFYLCSVVLGYLFNKFYLKEMYDNFFIDWYLNDLLGGMLYAILVVVLYRFWFKIELSNKYIFMFTLIAGLFWEYVTPIYYTSSTRDNWDIVCYLTGSAIYVLGQKLYKLLPLVKHL